MKKGLWYSVGGSPLSDSVEYSVDKDGQFTTTVVTQDIHPRPVEVAVVSLHGNRADYFATCQKGRKVVTGQITIVFSNLVPLGGIDVNLIRSRLPARFQSGFTPPKLGAWRPTPRLWEKIQKVIGDEQPSVREEIHDLRHIVAGSQTFRGRREGGLEVFERDAVATALQTWGGDSYRKRILRSAVPSRSTPVAPFLSQLKEVSLREDTQISHDHISFPGMKLADSDVVGTVVLSNTLGNEHLTILNCNRQPLEETLGVDLIYYNHRFDSYVLVQYKRMTGDEFSTLCYRPRSDASHDREIQRMEAAESAMRDVSGKDDPSTDAFRLLEQPFYMKLCETKAKAALDAGMVSGMYIPLELWRRQLRSSDVKGPKGGIVMSWETCKRRFNNSEFTRLLRQGWIGSAAGRTTFLSEIIENVLGSGRMLVLAATGAGSPSRDYRRDGAGRFTAEDDPTGAI
ncbi:MAG: hypothetical protein RLN60_03330 [Phycisphaerales bacterium]